MELVVLGSVFSSWYVELVFVVQSVCIRLVGKCGSESICPLLRYIQGKSTWASQHEPICILLVFECVEDHTCSGCLCRLHSCRMVLECVVVRVLLESCLVVLVFVVAYPFLSLSEELALHQYLVVVLVAQ